MKRYILAILALLPILFVGCQTDTTNVGYGGDDTTLTVSLSGTRTSLGGEANGKYPLYWSEGDCLAINGVESGEAQINATNPALATFAVNGGEQRPFSITYPYTSTTSKEAPMVVFPAEQSFVEDTFDKGCAPMYGYAKAGEEIALKHLAGILRFAMTAEEEVVLDRIVITSSTERLAGEFFVDCQSGTITPSDNASNSVTYTANTTLSSDDEKVFYISLPNGETGACLVEFIDSEGRKMTASWSEKSLSQGVVRKFSPITYKAGMTCELTAFDIEEDELLLYREAVGYIKDSNGNPIEGVAVSDGFSVVTTDSNGRYKLGNVSKHAWYIYISIPAEYEVPINEYGQPCFYKKYLTTNNRYDFTLTPLAGGKEQKFALFAFGDPQVTSNSALNRFNNECTPGIKKHVEMVEGMGLPCYGITLGDILSNSATNNDEEFRDDMRNGFAESKTGLPVFQVMGNHDVTFYTNGSPLLDNSNNAYTECSFDFQMKAQRNHEKMFGPVNYSFNRGDVHIVGMRDIIYKSVTSPSYNNGFLAEQYEWLKQDLALVPKDKMVVLCVHIPLFNNSDNFRSEILALLNTYKEVHIISGHTHYNRNYEHKVEGTGYNNIYEHNAGALCGAWWCSNMCGDGTPNGYQVFIGNGSTFSNWYFTGYHTGFDGGTHQMRLYRGNAVTGIDKSESSKPTNSATGYYAFNYGEDVLLANVYNADSEWVITVYEDEIKTGNMEHIACHNPAYTSLIGEWTYDNPRRSANGVSTSHDMYVAGLFLGVLGRYNDSDKSMSSGSWTECRHMYKYTLTNPKGRENIEDIKILVEAKDRFGNVFTESNITEGTDYSLTKKP